MDVFKFAEQFDKLSLDNKMQTQKRLQSTLDSGLSPSGIALKESERKTAEKLSAWCLLNIFVGGELAPPANVMN